MKINDGARTLDVRRTGAGTFDIDGREVAASVARVGPRVFVTLVDGSADARTPGASRKLVALRQGDRVFVADGARTRSYRIESRGATARHHLSSGSLESPMPGRVVKVAVAILDRVRRGQELIVIEAMKMENAIVAPFDGVVEKIHARAGEMVAAGALLVEVAEAVEPSA